MKAKNPLHPNFNFSISRQKASEVAKARVYTRDKNEIKRDNDDTVYKAAGTQQTNITVNVLKRGLRSVCKPELIIQSCFQSIGTD